MTDNTDLIERLKHRESVAYAEFRTDDVGAFHEAISALSMKLQEPVGESWEKALASYRLTLKVDDHHGMDVLDTVKELLLGLAKPKEEYDDSNDWYSQTQLDEIARNEVKP